MDSFGSKSGVSPKNGVGSTSVASLNGLKGPSSHASCSAKDKTKASNGGSSANSFAVLGALVEVEKDDVASSICTNIATTGSVSTLTTFSIVESTFELTEW